MHLVRKLKPFVKFKANTFVKAQLKLTNDIGLVVYRFAHGFISFLAALLSFTHFVKHLHYLHMVWVKFTIQSRLIT
jgi:hypothetical protein